MGPKKTAKNILSCDGCNGLVPKDGDYYIDASGFLLCAGCAAKGDVVRTVVV